jgi:hypothetical protein
MRSKADECGFVYKSPCLQHKLHGEGTHRCVKSHEACGMHYRITGRRRFIQGTVLVAANTSVDRPLIASRVATPALVSAVPQEKLISSRRYYTELSRVV